ncbi:hypothetical protein ScalyP_jg5995 [Parmales sp. scaly parma]|nr:hypothetical protein ScalyP_jg5995 [Parmales sp. scaly parma]
MPLYTLGLNLSKQIGSQFASVVKPGSEMDLVLEGFTDGMRGEISRLDSDEILTKYGPLLNELLQERAGNVVEFQKEEGVKFVDGFLAANPEATKTESGLVYLEMKAGEGKSPAITDTVEVHYHGQLTDDDGTVFDSSVDRGQTIKFPLGNVIKGWQEGLQLMKEGGKALLVIPSESAYGDVGSGETIPPGATLKFEVELFKVEST